MGCISSESGNLQRSGDQENSETKDAKHEVVLSDQSQHSAFAQAAACSSYL